MYFGLTCGWENLFWKSTFFLVKKSLNLSVLNIKKNCWNEFVQFMSQICLGVSITLCKPHNLICPSHVFIQNPYNKYCFLQSFSCTVQTINHIPDQIQTKLWIKLRREIILKNVDNWISCGLSDRKCKKKLIINRLWLFPIFMSKIGSLGFWRACVRVLL